MADEKGLVDLFRVVVRESGGRITRSRLAILEAICDMAGHFLPEDLARKLAERGEPVSLTTLYRNIPLLVEAGIIRETCISEGRGLRYELAVGSAHHDHLICSRCGRKIEFSYPAIDVLQEEVARSHGFVLERHHLELIGVCPECQEVRWGGRGANESVQ